MTGKQGRLAASGKSLYRDATAYPPLTTLKTTLPAITEREFQRQVMDLAGNGVLGPFNLPFSYHAGPGFFNTGATPSSGFFSEKTCRLTPCRSSSSNSASTNVSEKRGYIFRM